MEAIEFCRVQDAYGEFSNFAAFPVEIDGKRWPTGKTLMRVRDELRGESHAP